MSDNITVLNDKEKARKRINVWHGSSSNWINMIKELSGNSLDVFDKETLHHINIKIINNNKIEYIDDASGIPVEGEASDGRENYKALFEIPFAGSKYDNESATVGCNGVFLYTLAMTCEDITFEIARPNKNVYRVSYHKGDRLEDLKIIGKSDDTYSKITFSLDTEVWDNPNFTFDEIKNIVKGQASLSNVEITLEDVENNLKEVFYYEKGIEDYFKELTNNKTMITENIRFNKSVEQLMTKNNITDKIDIDILFNFSNDSEDDIQKDFLNTADLIQHGTIQDGIYLGCKNAIHKWLKDNNKYDKKDKNITLEDVGNGLNYICDVKSLNCEYVSQVKQQTLSPHYKEALKNVMEEFLEVFFNENPLQANLICTQILINSRARINADVTRKNIKKKLESLTNNTVEIEGLTDCNFKESTVNERILLIVEGLSPKATVVESYDNRYMGALGLRGRFISCLKKSIDNVLNNIPAYTLIQALGCGIEIPKNERKKFKDINYFDESKLRYGKIGIMVDADCWGSGIALAVLTFIYKYLPTLLKENRVYIIVSPRYEIKLKGDKMLYPYNDAEKEEIMKTINKEDIVNIEVIKGLGSINKDDFWDLVLRPEVQDKTFIQVCYDEVDEIVNKYFEDFMGEDVEPRKKFVKENIKSIGFEDLN